MRIYFYADSNARGLPVVACIDGLGLTPVIDVLCLIFSVSAWAQQVANDA